MLNTYSIKENKVSNKKVRNFQTLGFREAATLKGSVTGFRISLDKFYSKLQRRAEEKTDAILDAKNEYADNVKAKETEISVNEAEISRLKDGELKHVSQKIQSAKEELINFKANPEKYLQTKRDAFSYYLYMVLALLVSGFLYFFYTSVVYSAFFREIAINKETIFNSIFYHRAIEEAWRKGFTAFMIIALAPVIFLAFGIIIENLNKASKKLSYWTFIGVVFFLDSLLAYHISERIHDAKSLNSYNIVPEYSIVDAFLDPNFWMIIFFGFVVYFAFAKIFELFNNERSERNKIENMIRSLEAKIEHAIEEEKLIFNKIALLEAKNFEIRNQIAALQNPADKVFFSKSELRRMISDYSLGWINYLRNGKYVDGEVTELEESLKIFYEEKGLN